MAKYNAVKRAEKRAQKAQGREAASEAMGVVKFIWRFFSGGYLK